MNQCLAPFFNKVLAGYYECQMAWPDSVDADWIWLRQAHARVQLRLDAEFKRDAYEHFGLQPGDDADALYAQAWKLAKQAPEETGHLPVFIKLGQLVHLARLECFLRAT